MQTKKIHILIVEDDKNMGFLLEKNLQEAHFNTQLCIDGEEGYEAFLNQDFDLCLLDIMLPKKDGLSLALAIREQKADIPIIFLTARTMDMDKIAGFRAGCDDYVTKPFNIDILILRIEALLKRSQNSYQKSAEDVLFFGHTIFNTTERSLVFKEEQSTLSTKETAIIEILAKNKNKVVSRSVIMKSVWDRDDYFTSKNLDVYLTKLRKTIHKDRSVEIQNIHGYGYKLLEKSE